MNLFALEYTFIFKISIRSKGNILATSQQMTAPKIGDILLLEIQNFRT